MSGPARLVIQIWQGDTIVHEYQRATAQPTGAGVRRMLLAALGWMQAYSGQLGDDQWAADVERAKSSQIP